MLGCQTSASIVGIRTHRFRWGYQSNSHPSGNFSGRLALLAGVDRSCVGRIARGNNNVATLTLLKIAQALDMCMSDLLKDAGL